MRIAALKITSDNVRSELLRPISAMNSSIRLILFSKPGCHLCEGLREKLEQIESADMEVDVRDITTRPEWFQAFQYEIPVLFYVPPTQPDQPIRVERASPRAPVSQVEKLIQRAIAAATCS